MHDSNKSALAYALSVLGLSVALGGCSLFVTDVNNCENNQQCRDAFGPGWVCQADNDASGKGLCQPLKDASGFERCSVTYPSDLLQILADNPSKEPAERKEFFVFATLFDRTVEAHKARQNSAQLAFQGVNQEQGLEGKSFGLVFCDIQATKDAKDKEYDDELTRTEAAQKSAQWVIASVGVPGLIGPASSSDTQAVYQDILNDDLDVMIISPSATSPALSALDPPNPSDDKPGKLWRTAPPDSFQGKAIAADMREPGTGRDEKVETVAVLYEEGTYGESLTDVFLEEFTRLGGTKVTRVSFATQAQLSEKINEVLGLDVDEVVFISGQTPDAGAFLAGAYGKGVIQDGEMDIFLTDAAANKEVWEKIPSAYRAQAEEGQLRGSRPAPLDPNTNIPFGTFVTSYQGEFNDDVTQFTFTAQTYDAGWLVAYGSAWAELREGGRITGTHIAKGLRKISNEGGKEIQIKPSTWPDLLQQFREGIAVDVEGASGELDYDPKTEETQAPMQIWTFVASDGGLKEIQVRQ